MEKTVVKLFVDPAAAALAIKELVASGIKLSEVDIAVKSADSCVTLSREAGMDLAARVEIPMSLGFALSDTAAGGKSYETLAEIWGVPKDGMFYYESGLRRGGVVVNVRTDETGMAAAKAILRHADSSHVVPTDPPTNDGPFYLSERATKLDQRDKLFSGDFRKY